MELKNEEEEEEKDTVATTAEVEAMTTIAKMVVIVAKATQISTEVCWKN